MESYYSTGPEISCFYGVFVCDQRVVVDEIVGVGLVSGDDERLGNVAERQDICWQIVLMKNISVFLREWY